jgi:beta-glucosidase
MDTIAVRSFGKPECCMKIWTSSSLFPLLILCFGSAVSIGMAQTDASAFRNPSLSPEARAHDLVSQMTLEEKVSQMGSAAAAIPRLGVSAYNYWNEGLHGVARSGYATMFPQAIGMAATWDEPLFRRIGDVIATEARAKNNEALRHDNHEIYFGLTFWSPNINIFRDPRWGRGQETYGEDPYLTATLGRNFIEGLQGTDPKYFKVIATPKHFAVHSGPESTRHFANIEPSAHDLWDTYLPQFRTAIVDAKADSIMCAYNALYGEPACGSPRFLNDILRQDWKFRGFVTSDCGAIDDFFRPKTHQTEPDAEHADRTALLAGTDTNCGATYEKLGEAVRQKLIKESDIDRSLERLFEARVRLGQFDPPLQVPYASIPFSAVHSAESIRVARQTAQESMVLLKNDGILPLKIQRYRKIAVVGPNAAMLASLEGNYSGTPYDPILPVDALKAAMSGDKVRYAQGSPFVDGFALPVSRSMLHPTATSTGEGLKAEYFAEPSLGGKPVRSVIDPQINFDWNGVNPVAGAREGFAVRWTGGISAPKAGSYEFTLRGGPCRGCAMYQSFKVLIDGKEVAATEPPPTGAVAQAVRVNGTTGLPQEVRQQRPLRFTVAFNGSEQHRIEIDFIRKRNDQGSGLTLEWTPPPGVLLPAAVELASKSDLVIAILGLSPNLEGEEMPVKLKGFEGGDRTDIDLPDAQQELLAALTKTGKPLVVVLLNGSAIAINLAEEKANTILEAWYPGEFGGQIIADTLLGKNNPSGRLPVTFYKAASDLPAFDDYSMKNRTYRYFKGAPLYEFGYGLSYSKFSYRDLQLSTAQLQAGAPLTATVEISNVGKVAGDEVAEAYLIPPSGGNGGLSPRLHLVAYQRVRLMPGEKKRVTFELSPRWISEVDANGDRIVQAGDYELVIGGAQPKDARSSSQTQRKAFSIVGDLTLPH